jgi:hypothetical protein
MIAGFSTGALALGDFTHGVALATAAGLKAIELSSLRKDELPRLAETFREINLTSFEYVSVHAPSAYTPNEEHAVVELVQSLAEYFDVVVHPDAIIDFDLWRPLSGKLLLENMDRRKPTGRTSEELRNLFNLLPEAGLCFDIAHARHYDPSMTEAYIILKEHGHRIRQIHISEVATSSKHERISESAAMDYQEICFALPEVPIIIESPVGESEIADELNRVAAALSVPLIAQQRSAWAGQAFAGNATTAA